MASKSSRSSSRGSRGDASRTSPKGRSSLQASAAPVLPSSSSPLTAHSTHTSRYCDADDALQPVVMWARMPGFPAWPARFCTTVEQQQALGNTAAKAANAKQKQVAVSFLGVRCDKGWVPETGIFTFDATSISTKFSARKFKSDKNYRAAVVEAVRLLMRRNNHSSGGGGGGGSSSSSNSDCNRSKQGSIPTGSTSLRKKGHFSGTSGASAANSDQKGGVPVQVLFDEEFLDLLKSVNDEQPLDTLPDESCSCCGGTELSGPMLRCHNCKLGCLHWHCFSQEEDGAWLCDACCQEMELPPGSVLPFENDPVPPDSPVATAASVDEDSSDEVAGIYDFTTESSSKASKNGKSKRSSGGGGGSSSNSNSSGKSSPQKGSRKFSGSYNSNSHKAKGGEKVSTGNGNSTHNRTSGKNESRCNEDSGVGSNGKSSSKGKSHSSSTNVGSVNGNVGNKVTFSSAIDVTSSGALGSALGSTPGSTLRSAHEVSGSDSGSGLPDHAVHDHCFVCGMGGQLLVCDFPLCPRAFHQVCVLQVCPQPFSLEVGNDDDMDWDTPAEVEVDADDDGGYCEAEIKDEDEDDGHLLEESGIDEEEDEEEEEGQKVNDEDDEGSEDNAMDVEAVAEGHKSIGQKRKRLAPQDSPVPHHQQQHQQQQRQRQQDRHKKTHHRKNNELRIGCSQRSNGAGTLEQQLSQQRGQRARLIAAAISDPWFCPSHCCVGCSALQQTTCTLSAADLPLSYFRGMLDGSNTTAAAVFDGDKATMSGTAAANTASGYSDSRRGDDSQCGTHLNSYFPSTTIVRPAGADAAQGVHGAAGSTSANSDSASNGMGNSASTSTGAKAMSRALARLGVSAPAPAAASFASTSVTTAAAFIAGGTTNGDIMDSTVRRSTRKQQQQTRGLLMNGIGEPQSSYIPAGSVLQQKPLKMCSFCSFSVCRDCEVQLRPPGKGQALLISKRGTPIFECQNCASRDPRVKLARTLEQAWSRIANSRLAVPFLRPLLPLNPIPATTLASSSSSSSSSSASATVATTTTDLVGVLEKVRRMQYCSCHEFTDDIASLRERVIEKVIAFDGINRHYQPTQQQDQHQHQHPHSQQLNSTMVNGNTAWKEAALESLLQAFDTAVEACYPFLASKHVYMVGWEQRITEMLMQQVEEEEEQQPRQQQGAGKNQKQRQQLEGIKEEEKACDSKPLSPASPTATSTTQQEHEDLALNRIPQSRGSVQSSTNLSDSTDELDLDSDDVDAFLNTDEDGITPAATAAATAAETAVSIYASGGHAAVDDITDGKSVAGLGAVDAAAAGDEKVNHSTCSRDGDGGNDIDHTDVKRDQEGAAANDDADASAATGGKEDYNEIVDNDDDDDDDDDEGEGSIRDQTKPRQKDLTAADVMRLLWRVECEFPPAPNFCTAPHAEQSAGRYSNNNPAYPRGEGARTVAGEREGGERGKGAGLPRLLSWPERSGYCLRRLRSVMADRQLQSLLRRRRGGGYHRHPGSCHVVPNKVQMCENSRSIGAGSTGGSGSNANTDVGSSITIGSRPLSGWVRFVEAGLLPAQYRRPTPGRSSSGYSGAQLAVAAMPGGRRGGVSGSGTGGAAGMFLTLLQHQHQQFQPLLRRSTVDPCASSGAGDVNSKGGGEGGDEEDGGGGEEGDWSGDGPYSMRDVVTVNERLHTADEFARRATREMLYGCPDPAFARYLSNEMEAAELMIGMQHSQRGETVSLFEGAPSVTETSSAWSALKPRPFAAAAAAATTAVAAGCNGANAAGCNDGRSANDDTGSTGDGLVRTSFGSAPYGATGAGCAGAFPAEDTSAVDDYGLAADETMLVLNRLQEVTEKAVQLQARLRDEVIHKQRRMLAADAVEPLRVGQIGVLRELKLANDCLRWRLQQRDRVVQAQRRCVAGLQAQLRDAQAQMLEWKEAFHQQQQKSHR